MVWLGIDIEPIIVTFLYISFFISLVVWLIKTQASGANEFGVRAFLLLLSLAALAIGPVVDGLEYEDAYIHKAAAQYQSFHSSDGTDTFYTRACVAGSISDCVLEATFGTHLIGFSTLIAQVAKLIPERIKTHHLSNYLSALFAALTLQLLWSCLVKSNVPIVGRLVGVAFLLTSPAYYVVSVSSFSEPIFVFFLLATYYFYFTREQGNNNKILRLILYGTAMTLCVLVKKEGLLIAFVFMAISIFYLLRYKSRAAWENIAVSGLVIALGTMVFKIQGAAERHSSDIGTFAFNFSFASSLGNALFQAATSPSYFGILWIVFFVSAIFAVANSRSRHLNSRTSIAFLCVFSYAAIYALHARHYGFVHGEVIHPVEMVRYLYILMPFAVIAIGGALPNPLGNFIFYSQKLCVCKRYLFFTLLFCGCLYLTLLQAYRQRVDVAEDEAMRINLSRGAEDRGKIYISTSVLAAYAYLDEQTHLVDFGSLGVPAVQEMLIQTKNSDIVFLFDAKNHCDKALQRRFPSQCEFLKKYLGTR